jgi:hypothetical protein
MDQVDNGQRAVGLPQEVRSFRSRLQTYSREMNNVVIAVVLVHKYTYRIPEFQTAHSYIVWGPRLRTLAPSPLLEGFRTTHISLSHSHFIILP